MSSRRQLAWATGISLAGSVVMVMLSYPRNLMIARSLGPEALGLLAQAVMITGWAIILFGLGLNISISKYLSEHQSESALQRGGTRWTIRAGLVSGISGAMLVCLISIPVCVYVLHQPELVPVLLIVSLGIPFSILLYIASGVLLGLKNVKNVVLVNNILLPIVSTGLVMLAWLGGYGVRTMAWTTTVSAAIAGVVAYVLARKALGDGDHVLGESGPKDILTVGLVLSVSGFANVLWLKMDTFFLGLFWGAHSVGLYTPAYQTGYLLTYMIVAISSLFSPTVSAQVANKSWTELKALYIETSRWCFYGNMAIGLALFFGAFPFLRMFGKDFATEEAIVSLRILLPSFLFNSLVGAMSSILLAMGGKQKELAFIEISMIPIAIGLHMVFTRTMGLVGTSIAASAALIIVGIFRYVTIKRKFGFWGIEKAIWKGGVVLAVAALCAQRASSLSTSLPSWLQLVVIFTVAALAEFVMLFSVRDPTARDAQRYVVHWLQKRKGLVQH